ncbi:hypothetical protein HJFPF1_05919 [Paramyrothecium foliicola]|nr:hypothetical protein HJFPF1_05919 [Paramyrothecium foliicola]
MRLTSIIVPVVLSLVSGCDAWTQDGNGVWVADNHIYKFDNGVWIHKACTRRNTATVIDAGRCGYWKPGAVNEIHNGSCGKKPGMVICW